MIPNTSITFLLLLEYSFVFQSLNFLIAVTYHVQNLLLMFPHLGRTSENSRIFGKLDLNSFSFHFAGCKIGHIHVRNHFAAENMRISQEVWEGVNLGAGDAFFFQNSERLIDIGETLQPGFYRPDNFRKDLPALARIIVLRIVHHLGVVHDDAQGIPEFLIQNPNNDVSAVPIVHSVGSEEAVVISGTFHLEPIECIVGVIIRSDQTIHKTGVYILALA